GTQDELFFTFSSLHDKKVQMVFTCDRPIREIRNMAERLVSRLSNGLCIDLQPPTYEIRCAIIQKKLELQNKQMSSEIIEFIAKNVQTNIRDLESALNKILGYAELTNKEITMESAKNLLKDIFSGPNSENISLETIQKVIAKNYNITVAELKGKKRDKKFVIPRQIAIYITRELTEYSFTEIGNEFGGKDHSTIMHACEKINEQIKTDSSFDLKIQAFIREIREYKK
ncbi:MAG: chromosomal replication initiator protein DnaA, partial [Treponema sp.]|nr:chromosomal replication initiator protein DnaA [Treponema sp.]